MIIYAYIIHIKVFDVAARMNFLQGVTKQVQQNLFFDSPTKATEFKKLNDWFTKKFVAFNIHDRNPFSMDLVRRIIIS